MFWANVLIIRRSELHYTASGIITPIGGHLMHRLREEPVHETATYRCDDIRGCVMQFWPPVDEHMCLKHVEAWNKLTVKQKFCASSWLFTEINMDATPTQPHQNSNTHRTKNNTTNVVIQQNSHKLVMMDILMSETCWAHKKWNKIASDIKLVFYSSSVIFFLDVFWITAWAFFN